MIKYLRHSRLVLLSYFRTARFLYRFVLKKTHANDPSDLLEEGVTLVITSCARPELLEKTLRSFIEYNTFKIKKAILIEDGHSKESADIASVAFKNMDLHDTQIIVNDQNLGQLNSIDKAYSCVSTKYVFHLEEDWEFCKSGFIEDSLAVLDEFSDCLYLSLRSMVDQNNHPLATFRGDESYHLGFMTYKPLWRLVWTGFGFNPSLRRMADYRILAPYGAWNKREIPLGLAYLILGKKIYISKDKSYVKHLGDSESTYGTLWNTLRPRLKKD